MNNSNQDYLLNKFPNLYPTHFYFECGDGWFDVIVAMSEELCEAGYVEEVEQIKEKFGTLRVYLDGTATQEHDEIVARAEKQAAVTCEVCGKDGVLVGGGWLKTLCEEHKGGRT